MILQTIKILSFIIFIILCMLWLLLEIYENGNKFCLIYYLLFCFTFSILSKDIIFDDIESIATFIFVCFICGFSFLQILKK